MGSPKEIALVKSPRPKLAETLEAAKRGDVAATRAAIVAYDAIWNGIEVYVATRSRPHYQEVEGVYQRKIEEMLRETNPNLAEIVPLAETMLAKYDEAIKNSETGADLSTLFDDVAAIRLARAGLRAAGPALKAGDVARARSSFEAFQKAWPDVKGIVQQRSGDTAQGIDAAIAQAATAFQRGDATAAALSPLIDAVTERYNAGLTLVVTEARATLPG